MIDRLDSMRVFVTALNEGSLARAAQRLGRSPAAVTRALAALERYLGTALVHRTTRKLQLTEAGERYAAVCRHVLMELDEADLTAAGEGSTPHGVLTITAPVMFGTRILGPIVGEFLRTFERVQVRYLLLNRLTNIIDEGVDVALRIAPLPDSSLIAVRIGQVRQVLCASPEYLARRKPLESIADLAAHDCIAIEPTRPEDIWSFPPRPGRKMARIIRVRPRLMVNADEAAVSATLDGGGVVRIMSYKVQDEVRDGRLVILLPDDEPPPLPVHLVIPEHRLTIPKVRAFVDFATGRLRASFKEIQNAAAPAPPSTSSPATLP